MQEQAQAASLRQEVSRLGSEVHRLQSELNQERSSKEQHASRVTALEKELREETSSLVKESCAWAPGKAMCTHVLPVKLCPGSVRVHSIYQCTALGTLLLWPCTTWLWAEVLYLVAECSTAEFAASCARPEAKG